ncbi:hypothetical protein D3C71_1102870 [compost metagenome]
MDARVVRAAADLEVFLLGGGGFLGGDEAVLFHALDDVELARAGPLGVADGIVRRGRFGQTCKHGRLSHGHRFQGLAKIGF